MVYERRNRDETTMASKFDPMDIDQHVVYTHNNLNVSCKGGGTKKQYVSGGEENLTIGDASLEGQKRGGEKGLTRD